MSEGEEFGGFTIDGEFPKQITMDGQTVQHITIDLTNCFLHLPSDWEVTSRSSIEVVENADAKVDIRFAQEESWGTCVYGYLTIKKDNTWVNIQTTGTSWKSGGDRIDPIAPGAALEGCFGGFLKEGYENSDYNESYYRGYLDKGTYTIRFAFHDFFVPDKNTNQKDAMWVHINGTDADDLLLDMQGIEFKVY